MERVQFLMKMPESGPLQQLSLALANRSAALFQLGRYGPCEEAVQQALQHGYPREMRYKLHERLGEARRRQGDADRVKRLLETGQEGELQPEQTEHPDQKRERERTQKQGEQTEQRKDEQKQSSGTKRRREERKSPSPSVPQLPPLSHGPSEVVPAASAAVDLVVTQEKGRMLVANRDLSPGDVVIVEPALCSATLPDSWATHCYQCCARLQETVPCLSCSSVRFCSEACRTAAADQHVLECGLLERLLELDVGPMALLALRLVAAAGPEQAAAAAAGAARRYHRVWRRGLLRRHGTACVVRVIQPVPAGGELLDNYGFHWAVQGWTERQAALRGQYFFDCRCRACTEDWAPHMDLPEKEYFLCDLCDAPPIYCYHEKDASKVEAFTRSRRAFLKAMERRKQRGGTVDDVEALVNHLRVMQRVVAKPSREFNNCQEAVKLHFFAEGNSYQELAETQPTAKSMLKEAGTTETLNCIERLYGKNKRITA
ncbi:SET and MYND domain-containing protein 4 [Amphibalanus amphitrite]|uniref:SET and MYND domain-containing protein 4 n=1 Tax=Amphibalanus amphitrite TaxID=1232801 RepID=A0A6A4V8G8_AMPAM|nr:SET and MYND domain-containing protein 4 [Amphibalanus amphitrite]